LEAYHFSLGILSLSKNSQTFVAVRSLLQLKHNFFVCVAAPSPLPDGSFPIAN